MPINTFSSFTDGLDPRTNQLDAGLFFLAYGRDHRQQFVPMQERLAHGDAAMKSAVEAGRHAYLAGRMPRREVAVPSSPTTGMLGS